MGWLILVLLLIIVIIGIAFTRNSNENYRFGSGLFKSSEFNLDEKDELPDKDYYDDEGLYK